MSDSTERARVGGKLSVVLRGALGGTLMGLANLVPGISGGTMLLAAGVYPGFIEAIADLTTFRFRLRPVLLLGTIVAAAAFGILLLAGTVKSLVVEHRWIMYSLFIGLTLGGVPLVWRMARPATPALSAGCVVAFGLMLAMALGGPAASAGGTSMLLTFAAGLAASSAMILPGVSGGYLLLLLGQYETILGTVDQLKRGLLGDGAAGPDVSLVLDAMTVVLPLGLGIVVGVAGVSNLLKWLLHRYEKATLGALLGLLFGAVIGLWPFQQGTTPEIGDTIKGRVVAEDNLAEFAPEDWPVRSFDPSFGQAAGAAGLVVLGLSATLLIGRLGGGDGDAA
ncbi:MAG: DUF368 domain-containing protein [Myxococcota bacterium]